MVSNSDKWVRIFDIPEISRHRKRFTIYKIISMLYPETCPDAITKVSVWKRFNDFKKMHREIKILHSKLNLKDKYPTLPSSTFFKRFDDEIVQHRRLSMLSFLEYVGNHPPLFTSNAFVKFFETSHSPVHQQHNGNINLIRANLHLPDDPEYLVTNSDDDPTISDTDSVTTVNSFGLSFQNNNELGNETISHGSKLSSLSSLNTSMATSPYINFNDSFSISANTDNLLFLNEQLYPSSSHSPGGDTPQYITDAAIHVNIAIELENEQKYEETFTAYKTAIDILLKYGKDDRNYNRKQMVHYKTEKYLIRAEKIYNMYLATEIKNLKHLTVNEEGQNQYYDCCKQRPNSDLYKYKVVRIIANGMLVLHSELQQLFYIKVIHKNMKFLNENLILPENVPYMIKLFNYYNCENALFLVLAYCSGKKLWDYIKYRSENPDEVFFPTNEEILKEVQNVSISDPESEPSYSDLINDYTNNKNHNDTSSQHDQEQKDSLTSDDSYEKISSDDLVDFKWDARAVPSKAQIVCSSSKTQYFNEVEFYSKLNLNDSLNSQFSNQRRISEMSSVDELDISPNITIPIKEIVKWSAQLILALEKLHTLGVICCDLQSHNLLIDDNGDLVMTYMCNVNEPYDIYSNRNSKYVAPELYSFEPITTTVDWWCFGTILYELLVGMPLSCIHPDGLMSSTHLKIPNYVSPEGRSLLKQLLAFFPQERLGYGPNGIDNLKSHPFFHDIRWEKILQK